MLTLQEATELFLREQGTIAWWYNPFEGSTEVIISFGNRHGACCTSKCTDRCEAFCIAVQRAKDAV